MHKKGVPEWMSSSLWSSLSPRSKPHGDPLARSATNSSTDTPRPSPPCSAPPPLCPPPVLEPPPTRSEIRVTGGDPTPSAVAEEEISRQSQLLAEVRCDHRPVNLPYLFFVCDILDFVFWLAIEEGYKFGETEETGVSRYSRWRWDSIDSVEGDFVTNLVLLLNVAQSLNLW